MRGTEGQGEGGTKYDQGLNPNSTGTVDTELNCASQFGGKKIFEVERKYLIWKEKI